MPRRFSITENNKGLPCPFKFIHCQEGWCDKCQIYLDKQSRNSAQWIESNDPGHIAMDQDERED